MFDDLGQGWPLIWKNLENLKCQRIAAVFRKYQEIDQKSPGSVIENLVVVKTFLLNCYPRFRHYSIAYF